MSRVIQALAAHAVRSPGRIAMSSEGRQYTYAALDEAVRRASVALMRIDGVRSARPVAILLENSPAWVILDLALVRLGCPSLPLPGFFTAAQRRHALDDAGAAALVTVGEGESGFVKIAGVPLHVESSSSWAGSLPPGTAKVTYSFGFHGAAEGRLPLPAPDGGGGGVARRGHWP